MATLSEQFPHLAHLCAAYFHQDWAGDALDPLAVIEQYKRRASPEQVSKTAQEISQLLQLDPSEAWLNAVLQEDLGCYYAPEADGLTAAAWLRQVQEKLLV